MAYKAGKGRGKSRNCCENDGQMDCNPGQLQTNMEAGGIQDPFLFPMPHSVPTQSRPVCDLGSLAIDPSRLTTLTTKFFSRVKLV